MGVIYKKTNNKRIKKRKNAKTKQNNSRKIHNFSFGNYGLRTALRWEVIPIETAGGRTTKQSSYVDINNAVGTS